MATGWESDGWLGAVREPREADDFIRTAAKLLTDDPDRAQGYQTAILQAVAETCRLHDAFASGPSRLFIRGELMRLASLCRAPPAHCRISLILRIIRREVMADALELSAADLDRIELALAGGQKLTDALGGLLDLHHAATLALAAIPERGRLANDIPAILLPRLAMLWAHAHGALPREVQKSGEEYSFGPFQDFVELICRASSAPFQIRGGPIARSRIRDFLRHLAALAENAPSAANVAAYVDVVRGRARQRYALKRIEDAIRDSLRQPDS